MSRTLPAAISLTALSLTTGLLSTPPAQAAAPLASSAVAPYLYNGWGGPPNPFKTMLAHARQHHLARLTFWSVDRDRLCTGGPADSCSGVNQSDWDFTRVFAGYTG